MELARSLDIINKQIMLELDGELMITLPDDITGVNNSHEIATNVRYYPEDLQDEN